MTIDHYAPRTYEVRHATTYTYADPRDAAFERGHMTPRDCVSQSVRETTTIVTPEPDSMTVHRDLYGNPSYYIEIRSPHTVLEITKRSIVDVAWPEPDMARLNELTVAEATGFIASHLDPVDVAEFTLASPKVQLVPEVADYARKYLQPDLPFGDAMLALTRGIYADFTYKSGATTVNTTLPELLAGRQGVCQDFAHLAVGCLRTIGLPARYVSGYIETTPPPGKPKLAGSDASHAWVSVLTPSGAWLDMDPTNDHFADSRYIVSAWGRDFSDVSPLRGIIYGQPTTSTLNVGVDVIRLDEHGVAINPPVPRPAASLPAP